MEGIGGDDGQGELVGGMEVMFFEHGVGEAASVPESDGLTKVALGLSRDRFRFSNGGEEQEVRIAFPAFEDIGGDDLRANDFAGDVCKGQKLVGAEGEGGGGFVEENLDFPGARHSKTTKSSD